MYRQREEMLYQLKVVQTPPASGRAADSPWILVDSDGEEVMDVLLQWGMTQVSAVNMAHVTVNHILVLTCYFSCVITKLSVLHL